MQTVIGIVIEAETTDSHTNPYPTSSVVSPAKVRADNGKIYTLGHAGAIASGKDDFPVGAMVEMEQIDQNGASARFKRVS